MNKIKFISIFVLLIGFTFALVQCAKEEDNSSSESINFDDSNFILKILADNGIYREKSEDHINFRVTLNVACIPGDSCYYIGEFTDTMQIPGTCDSAYVYFKLHYCNGQFTFSDFAAYPMYPECNNIWVYWWHLADQGKHAEMEISMDSFEYAASWIYEQDFMNLFVNAANIKCEDGNSFSSTWIRNICYNYCLEISKGKLPWPFPNWFKWKITKIKCGDKCCVRTRSFCLNDDGSLNVSGPTWSVIGEDVCSPVPSQGCNGWWLGRCEHECGSPY